MSNNNQSNENVKFTTGRLAGHQVNRIGFGAMQLPGPGVWGPPRDRKTALAVLRDAIALGVNHLDTAQFYGPDVANELIREALYPYPENVVIVSKIGAERDRKGGWIPAQRPEQLRASVEDNLRSLQIDRLPVVNLRLMDASPDGAPVPKNQQIRLDDQISEMNNLRDEGKIEGFGISNANMEQLQQALPAGIACVQNAYSLLNRKDEQMLQVCLEKQIAWVPFFPLGSAGFPGIAQVTKHPLVIQMAKKMEATPAQIGLAWLLAHAPNILLIPGTSDPDHLAENVAAGELSLDQETKDSLDKLTAITD